MAGTEGQNTTPVLVEVEDAADGSVVVFDPADAHLDDDDAGEVGTAGATGAEEANALEAAADRAEEAGAASDADREAIRARRREERRQKKDAQRQRESDFQRELAMRDTQLNEMRQTLAQLQNRNVAADMAQLDTAIKRSASAFQYYKGVVEEATKKQDGGAVADATENMMRSRAEAERLLAIKQQFASQANAPTALDPALKANADNWMRQNDWYDPSGADQDSAIVLTLDARLAQEGYNPKDPSYWKELQSRVARYLPHRAKAGQNDGATQQGRPVRTPVAGSGREGGADSSRRSGSTYQLSAARVQALKDAGSWDDPQKRSDAIRRYRAYDRANSIQG